MATPLTPFLDVTFSTGAKTSRSGQSTYSCSYLHRRKCSVIMNTGIKHTEHSLWWLLCSLWRRDFVCCTASIWFHLFHGHLQTFNSGLQEVKIVTAQSSHFTNTIDRGLSFLVHAASVTKTNKFFDLVDIMEKALRYYNASYNIIIIMLTWNNRVPNDRQRYEAAMALIRLFIKKFRDKRHTHTLYILERLLKLAKDRQYLLRKVVISFLLSFRANSQYLMQLNISRQVKDKTNNVTVEEKQASFGESGADSSPTRNLPELDAESSKSRAKKPSSPPNSPINKTETTREELIPKYESIEVEQTIR